MNLNFYKRLFCIILFSSGTLYTSTSFAENVDPSAKGVVADTPIPHVSALYLSDLSNPTEFTLFANSGWDGGWFVGYSKSWVQQIEVPQHTNIIKAFIGAKLGRMKVESKEEKPAWESTAIPGKIFIAISSTPSWKNSQTFFLTSTEDIPYEGLPEDALTGVGESRWFWVEVPLDLINFEGNNYVVLWSTSKKLNDINSSPIIAAGWDIKDKRRNTWLFKDLKRNPPDKFSDGSPLSYFEPALAIKLAPQNAYTVLVHLKTIPSIESDGGKLFFAATVTGVNIEKTWVEISQKGKKWERYNRCLYNTPYVFTLEPATLPKKKFKLRAAAQDELGNTGYSNELELMNE